MIIAHAYALNPFIALLDMSLTRKDVRANGHFGAENDLDKPKI